MDDYDRRLLKIVQTNNRLTNEEMAAKVHMSPSAVRQRLRRLRAEGVIARDVAILKPAKLGLSVATILRCTRETHDTYERISKRMLGCAEITQCYTISGPGDFLLIGHFKDMDSYNAWIEREVLASDDVERCDTHFVYSTVKNETAIPV